MKRGPVIIEAAVNGATRPEQNPHVPRTPHEIAEVAIQCIDAGAAIVHNHNDDPNVGGPAQHDPEPYRQAWSAILAEHPQAIVHPTVRGGTDGVPIEERYAHLDALYEAGLLRMASADPGIVSIGFCTPELNVSFAYGNTGADAAYMFGWCRQRDLPAHISIFEPGFLRLTLEHHRAGTLPRRSKIQLYFGGPALLFGLPPTSASLDAYLAMLEGTGLAWMVGVLGGDIVGCGLAARAIERGGHVRVGLEDYAGDRVPDNVELVAEAARMVRNLGGAVADSDAALEILAG